MEMYMSDSVSSAWDDYEDYKSRCKVLGTRPQGFYDGDWRDLYEDYKTFHLGESHG